MFHYSGASKSKWVRQKSIGVFSVPNRTEMTVLCWNTEFVSWCSVHLVNDRSAGSLLAETVNACVWCVFRHRHYTRQFHRIRFLLTSKLHFSLKTGRIGCKLEHNFFKPTWTWSDTHPLLFTEPQLVPVGIAVGNVFNGDIMPCTPKRVSPPSF